ncbi:MAG: sugar ABC transporter ATP-binding protein [Planctomycetota bacterium]
MTEKKQTRLLKMDRICKAFSGVQVLCDVGFDLYSGEVHVLAGENGAGKSTLIKILGGVYDDFTGRIHLGSEQVRFKSVTEAAAKGISIIHQELSLVGSMSVAENIFLGREKTRRFCLDKTSMTRQAHKRLASLGLDIDVSRPVADFSLGTQQMVEICKALALDCRIIIMDEPTSALTEPEVEKLFDIIEKLKNQGCGIIYISHKMEEIYRIADRITVLRDGRYIGTASASELDREKMVQWMVGRQLNQQFPRHLTQTGDVRLEVKNFCIHSSGGKTRPRQVDDVSFRVRAGEILGIAGLAGSGRSQLLGGIFGTYGKQVSGQIKIDGKKFRPTSPKKAIDAGIALLTNDRKENGLVMEMNIVQNTTLASLGRFSPGGWLRPKRETAAAEKQTKSLKLKATSLGQLVNSLSGGNQQKVIIAKWIQTEPAILLLDEPTRGVDVGAKHEIYQLMNNWTEKSIAIVLITSEMPELLAMSDRIIVMHRGRITAEFAHDSATQEKILAAAMGEKVPT